VNLSALPRGAGHTFTEHGREGCSLLRIHIHAILLSPAFVSITASYLNGNAFALFSLHIPAMPTDICYNFPQ
jgi:hypothetical protein